MAGFGGLAAGPPASPQTPIVPGDFVVEDGQGVTTIQDPNAPVSFQLPAGWTLLRGVRWGDHETTLFLLDTTSSTAAITVYYQYPIQSAIPLNLDAALVAGMQNKVKQRQQEGLKNYHIRTGSGQTSVVDGRPALSFIGDFNMPQGQAMSEYMLRVLGANTKAEFFVKVPAAADLGSFSKRLVSIAQTLRMP